MTGFSRGELIQGARLLLPEAYSHAPDHQVEAAFEGQLALMENNTANIVQGIAGAVGSLGGLIGNIVGGDTGRTIGQVTNVASGLGNMGANIYRQFSPPTPGAPMTPSPMMPSPMMPSPMMPSPMMPSPFMGTPPTLPGGAPPQYPLAPFGGQPFPGAGLPPNWAATAAGLIQNPMFLRAVGAAMLPQGAQQVPLRPGGAQSEGIPVEELLALASETFRRAAAEAAGVESEAPLSGRFEALIEACSTYAELSHTAPAGYAMTDFEMAGGDSGWFGDDADW